MIWDPRIDPDASDSDIVSHITAEIHAVCGEDVLAHVVNVKELARAVETYVRDEAADSYVDSAYLASLASRALSSVGEGTAARRLFLFGTDFVTPSEWLVSGTESMWVLDLDRMTVRNNVPLELVFFRSLNAVIESIADVWDSSCGRGILGLRHVCASAAALLGSGQKEDASALGAEIRDRCERKLGQVRTERDWETVPVVMNLDGAGGQ